MSEDLFLSSLNDEQPLMACEPIGATSTSMPSGQHQHYFIPTGVPQSFSAAIDDIEEGEKEFNRGDTFTHQEVMQMVWDKIQSYAGKV